MSVQLRAATLEVASDAWCPYICIENEYPGYVVELTQTAFRAIEVSANVQYLPLKRSLNLTNQNVIDATLALTPDHLHDYKLQSNSQPIGAFANDFFTRNDNSWEFISIADLKARLSSGLRLGLITGYSYGPEIDQIIQTHPEQVFKANGDNPLLQLLRMLSTERIDVILDSRATVQYTAKRHGIDTLRYAGTEGETIPLFIGFAPKTDAELIAQFNLELQQMREDGRLNTIIERYQIEMWQ